jgi:hypothetical protein
MQAAMGSILRLAVIPQAGVMAVVVVQVRQAEMEVVLPRTELTLETAETVLSGPAVAGTTTAAAAGVQSTYTTQQRQVLAVWVVVATVDSTILPDLMV